MNNQPTTPCYEYRALFSDYYLTDRIRFPQALQEDCLEAYQKALDIYQTKKAALRGMNEAQTENDFNQLLLSPSSNFGKNRSK